MDFNHKSRQKNLTIIEYKRFKIYHFDEFQTLRHILLIERYITTFHVETIEEKARIIYLRIHKKKLQIHLNPPLIKYLSVPTISGNSIRILKRKWCRNLLQN
jgi:hypothetical protein